MCKTINNGINHIKNEYSEISQITISLFALISAIILFALLIIVSTAIISWQLITQDEINQFIRALALSTIPVPSYLYYVGSKLSKETK